MSGLVWCLNLPEYPQPLISIWITGQRFEVKGEITFLKKVSI